MACIRAWDRPRSAYRTSSLTSSPLISIDVLPFILFCIRRDPRPSQPTQRCEERRFPGAAPNPAETFRSPPAASAPPCPGRHGATYLYRLHYTGFSRLCPPYFPRFRSHLWKTMPQLKFFLPPPKNKLLILRKYSKIYASLVPASAGSKAALVGEIAVPCTCNPLKQG